MPPRASGGSRPTGNCRSCGPRWLLIRPSTPSTPTLNSRPRPHSLLNQRRLPSEFQQGSGHPRAGDPKDVVFVTGKGWVRRDGEEKMKVMTLVERGGKARSVHIDRATSAELNRVLVAKADPQSRLM